MEKRERERERERETMLPLPLPFLFFSFLVFSAKRCVGLYESFVSLFFGTLLAMLEIGVAQ